VTPPNDRGALEATVLECLARSDTDGAATIVLRGLGPEILGYLAAICRDMDVAQEAFSQFCEDAWRGLPGFRRESSLAGWAYRVARHAAIRVLRDPYRRRGRRLETAEYARLAQEVRASSIAFLRTTARDGIARLRERITPDEQTLLVLRVDRQLDWQEVGHVLAEAGDPVDEAALRKRFERVKRKLRRMAEAEGLLGE
jgi:RNA polymerase sigma-70 factor (ECF subfamily)